MRLKSLFSVPEKQKITEKYLHRVLIFSICSIFLCLSCLTGLTWAWFSVSVENPGNEIQIGEPAITLEVDNAPFASGSELPAAEEAYTVTLGHANAPDDLENKSTLYVTFTIAGSEKTIIRYVTLDKANEYCTGFNIQADAACTLSWVVSWFQPDNAEELTGDTIVVEAPPEPTTEPTEPSSEPTEPSSEPTEPSSEPTEPSSEPTEPSSEPTEPSSEPTEPSSEPTEPSSEPTDPSSEPAEPSSEATDPSEGGNTDSEST